MIPMCLHQGVTILFFQFHKMVYFFFKWHDSDATHCHLSFWWQKSSQSWITDITETHKNVLTFLTHNDIRLIVSILNLSKNICEKIVQWLITNDWSQMAEEQIVRLKKNKNKKLQNLSCKRILMGRSEANQKRFSDSSGLYIAINLIYSNQ